MASTAIPMATQGVRSARNANTGLGSGIVVYVVVYLVLRVEITGVRTPGCVSPEMMSRNDGYQTTYYFMGNDEGTATSAFNQVFPSSSSSLSVKKYCVPLTPSDQIQREALLTS